MTKLSDVVNTVVKGMLHSQENVPVSFNSRLVDGKENLKPWKIHSISGSSNSFTVHSELEYMLSTHSNQLPFRV